MSTTNKDLFFEDKIVKTSKPKWIFWKEEESYIVRYYYKDKECTILHREGGKPAVEGKYHLEFWENGELHREDGPAIEDIGSDYLNDYEINFDEYHYRGYQGRTLQQAISNFEQAQSYKLLTEIAENVQKLVDKSTRGITVSGDN